jgi:hypothetical protein
MQTTKPIFRFASLFLAALLVAGCSKKPAPPSAEAPPASPPAPAASVQAQQPKDWIVVNETEYIPVVDELSAQLSSARKAFIARNWKEAAGELRTAAGLLDQQATGGSRRSKPQLSAVARSLRDLAGTVEAGKLSSVKPLDAAIASAHRADLERDWLVEEVTAWYPYVSSPNSHFQAAHDSFLSKEYKKASEEIRKGAAFVRLEAGSAVDQAKQDLQASEQELQRLAKEVEQGSVHDVQRLDRAFARASNSLALSHRIKAGEAWNKKELRKAGNELQAAATLLESGANWVGAEAKASVAATVRDTRLVAEELTAESSHVAQRAGEAITALGKSIEDFGRRIEPQKN